MKLKQKGQPGNPVEMACLGPLLDPIPTLPPLSPSPRYLTPPGQAHAITMENCLLYYFGSNLFLINDGSL